MRLVAARPCAHRDEGEAVRTGVRTAGRFGVDADEGAFPHRNVLAVDRPVTAARDHRAHLLVARLQLGVLHARRVGREVESVDAERLHAELPADEPNDVARAGRLDVVDVGHGVRHEGDSVPRDV